MDPMGTDYRLLRIWIRGFVLWAWHLCKNQRLRLHARYAGYAGFAVVLLHEENEVYRKINKLPGFMEHLRG